MATDKEHEGKFELSRRDFLKAGAAAAVVGAVGADLAITPSRAEAAAVAATYHTSCPYCSAQCGQLVDVDAAGNVLDIYGDPMSPTSRGGLCAKGAGAYQLVTNPRRIGVPEHTVAVDGYNFTGAEYAETAWYRDGNGAWTATPLATAMTDIAARLVSARGPVNVAAGTSTLLAAPATIATVDYLGFSSLGVVAKGDGTYFVGTGGVKVDSATLGADITAALGGNTTALAADIDDLVFSAIDPTKYSTWTLAGTSNLKSQVFAASKIPDSVDIVRDGSTYYAYVATMDGTTLRFQSTDMLAWGSMANLGAPGNTFGMVNPSVIKSGSTLKVWHNRYATAPLDYDYKLWYSEYDGTTWSSAVAVTHDGSQLASAGHPYVSSDGTNYTLKYTGAGLFTATAPVATPAAFGAGTLVYNGANVETNVVGGSNYLMYTENDGSPMGYAYSTLKVWTAAVNNAKTVQFLGCSHMNNEPNYLYRKLIADFGTSMVEHQARI